MELARCHNVTLERTDGTRFVCVCAGHAGHFFLLSQFIRIRFFSVQALGVDTASQLAAWYDDALMHSK